MPGDGDSLIEDTARPGADASVAPGDGRGRGAPQPGPGVHAGGVRGGVEPGAWVGGGGGPRPPEPPGQGQGLAGGANTLGQGLAPPKRGPKAFPAFAAFFPWPRRPICPNSKP